MTKTLALIAGLALLAAPSAYAAENPCAEPAVAGFVISGLDFLRSPKDKGLGLSVVDVTTITTVPSKGSGFSCHVTAEFSDGMHIPGTFSAFKNAAGNVVVQWNPDGARHYRGA